MTYTVIRHYTGGSTLMDELEKRSDAVETLIRGVPGFQQYYLVRTGDGGFSVSVYDDEAGANESVRAAKQFIAENVPDAAGDPPQVMAGDVFVSFSRR